MKQKKEYGRPVMRVVELRHKCSLLTMSETPSSRASMSVEYQEEDI